MTALPPGGLHAVPFTGLLTLATFAAAGKKTLKSASDMGYYNLGAYQWFLAQWIDILHSIDRKTAEMKKAAGGAGKESFSVVRGVCRLLSCSLEKQFPQRAWQCLLRESFVGIVPRESFPMNHPM